jgi:hypothetical protein
MKLIAKGADLNVKNKSKETSLDVAQPSLAYKMRHYKP